VNGEVHTVDSFAPPVKFLFKKLSANSDVLRRRDNSFVDSIRVVLTSFGLDLWRSVLLLILPSLCF